MLTIKIIAIGKLKEKFWEDAYAEYAKRISAYAKLSLCEIADIDPNKCGGIAKSTEKEADSILNNIEDGEYVSLLDVKGKPYSSEDIAELFESIPIQGVSKIVFILGGSDGVHQIIKDRANSKISFGKITLPHNLARIVLVEQIYRVFKINRGEPYHK